MAIPKIFFFKFYHWCVVCKESHGLELDKTRNQTKYCSIDAIRELPSGPEVIKLFSCSNQLRMKLNLLIVVKMTVVGILTFMSGISDWLC